MKQIFPVILSVLFLSSVRAQDNTVSGEPVVNKDTLVVKMGDKLLFGARMNETNGLVFTQVMNKADSAKTVSIDLVFSEGIGSMLKIFNPFDRQLVYKAELYNYKKKEFVETSTVPVYPGLSSFETWPYKIDIIRLSGFRLAEGR